MRRLRIGECPHNINNKKIPRIEIMPPNENAANISGHVEGSSPRREVPNCYAIGIPCFNMHSMNMHKRWFPGAPMMMGKAPTPPIHRIRLRVYPISSVILQLAFHHRRLHLFFHQHLPRFPHPPIHGEYRSNHPCLRHKWSHLSHQHNEINWIGYRIMTTRRPLPCTIPTTAVGQ